MAAAKKVAKKKPSKTAAKGSARKTAKKPPKTAARKKKPASSRGGAAKSKKLTKRRPALGRVKVPSDARLDLVFQKDYQAREIFDYLKLQTIRELEALSHDEILDRLAGPMFQTVQRIRKALALANRHLAKDEKFAKAFLVEIKKLR